ncbi:hypothetical protein [Guyparkeria halopsychrophila]|uniref:hypothetical protein n=1 Tax=Guyparkeria halopsychrophila TaxID=3139421 RepID=UPI0037C5643D
MPTPPLTRDAAQEVVDTYEACLRDGFKVTGVPSARAEAARRLDLPTGTFNNRLRRAAELYGIEPNGETPPAPFEVEKPDSEHTPIEDLLAIRKKRFARKRRHEEQRALIPVRINLPGPIGICHFGDPHVDDDGTDLEALERDSQIVRETEGLFAGNIGDTTNNWIGRLARLYGEQGTTEAEAWMLAEWFITGLREEWLYLIGGNHDAWSGAGDPLQWILRQEPGVYQSSETRLELMFPNGQRVRINAHHDFSGHSQWNPAHGSMKAAQMGFHDHILINGHKHVSGYGIVKDPANGVLSHCIQVASYKVYDRYAREKGFRDQHISPAVVTVIDPDAKDQRGLITTFWDVQQGADFLTYLRERKVA